jgi:hypothetical protein
LLRTCHHPLCPPPTGESNHDEEKDDSDEESAFEAPPQQEEEDDGDDDGDNDDAEEEEEEEEEEEQEEEEEEEEEQEEEDEEEEEEEGEEEVEEEEEEEEEEDPPAKPASTAKTKLRETLDTLHREMDVATYSKTHNGQYRRVVPKALSKQKTKKRRKLEREDYEIAEPEMEAYAKRKKRLRGSQLSMEDDVVQATLPLAAATAETGGRGRWRR